MDTDQAPPAVAAYLARIGDIALLTVEQEICLAERIQEAGPARERLRSADDLPAGERRHLEAVVRAGHQARSDMVTANLRLVVAQAKRYADTRTSLLDLIQEGNVGLIRAVERFDPHLGFRFSTYATWWIRQSIAEALGQQRAVHLPPKAYRQLAVCRRAREVLQASLGRRPTTAEIAREVGYDDAQVRRLLRFDLPMVSLDDPVPGGAAAAVQDGRADTAGDADRALTVECVAEAVDDLPPIERDVVRMRFGIGQERQSRTETARRLDLGLSAVRRIERRALRRLRGWERLNRLRTERTA